jgi:hypothetical protein
MSPVFALASACRSSLDLGGGDGREHSKFVE